jgi:transcriptional regulator with GAF, ATPase, and Fis domain
MGKRNGGKRMGAEIMVLDNTAETLDPEFQNKSQEGSKAFVLFRKVQKAMDNLPDFIETCKAILDGVVEETKAENCSLMLKDPVTGELSVCIARGKEEGKSISYPARASKGKRFKPGEGVAGWVLQEGREIILDNVREEPRFIRTVGLKNNIKSLLCFPIMEKDQVVGVFNLSHSQKGAFDPWEKVAMSFISNQIGSALTSTRFYLDLNQVTQLMEDAGKAVALEAPVPSHPEGATLIEIGEMTRENGMFIYASNKMYRIKETIDQVANTDVTVLIQGESGVGKEVVARSIHLNSLRRDKPFVKVNCAALPSELLESELFGYEKGAFTGAYRQKPGKFELAQGGTIFLDEIADITLALQAKLLQVLQDHEFSRLGGKKDIRVDVRVLAATNTNLEDAVRNGQFREDLYYRLNVVSLTVPPLRERREEILIFVEYFLDKFGKKYNRKLKKLSDRMKKALLQNEWTGNVRELENVIQRFVVLGNEEMILEELSQTIRRNGAEPGNNNKDVNQVWPSLREVQRQAIIEAESKVIRKALDLTNWNRKKAAQLLNISYKTLLYKIKDCEIDKPSMAWTA